MEQGNLSHRSSSESFLWFGVMLIRRSTSAFCRFLLDLGVIQTQLFDALGISFLCTSRTKRKIQMEGGRKSISRYNATKHLEPCHHTFAV